MSAPTIYRFLSPAQIAAGTHVPINKILGAIQSGILPAVIFMGGSEYAVNGKDIEPWLMERGIVAHTLNLRHQ